MITFFLIVFHLVAAALTFGLVGPVLDSLFVFIAPGRRKASLIAALEDARAGATRIFDEWTKESRDLWRCRREILGGIDHEGPLTAEEAAAFHKRYERYLVERISYLEKLEWHERMWLVRQIGKLGDHESTVARLLVAGISLPLGWYEITAIFLSVQFFGNYLSLVLDRFEVAFAPRNRKQLLARLVRKLEQGDPGIYSPNRWSQEDFDFNRLRKLFTTESEESFAFGPWCDYLRRRIGYLEELEREPRIRRLWRGLTVRSIVKPPSRYSGPPGATARDDHAKVPTGARQLLLLVASRSDIVEELEEEFYETQGAKKRWYWSQVLRSVPPQLCSKLRNALVTSSPTFA